MVGMMDQGILMVHHTTMIVTPLMTEVLDIRGTAVHPLVIGSLIGWRGSAHQTGRDRGMSQTGEVAPERGNEIGRFVPCSNVTSRKSYLELKLNI
jgi:hypothetical protein